MKFLSVVNQTCFKLGKFVHICLNLPRFFRESNKQPSKATGSVHRTKRIFDLFYLFKCTIIYHLFFRLLGNFLEAAKDLRLACKIDFDDQADEWLREVTPNVSISF